MTLELPSTPAGPWTPRTVIQLSVLAAAAFIYVTAETVPVGALPAISRGLGVSEALVGTLLAWYAVVAAATTIPMVRWTAAWPRRTTLLLTLTCLTVSQLISALAPNFWVLAGARVLCAVTHGLMWAVIAPIAARLVPASHSGRATTVIYVGTSLALILGNPLTAAMSLLWGWREAVVVVTAGAAIITVVSWLMLPELVLDGESLAQVGRRARHHRNGPLVNLSLLTLVAVAGHFISYTFILVIIRDVVGVDGPNEAWLLAAFGVAGLIAMPVVARPMDRHPKVSITFCMASLAGAFALLAALAVGGHSATVTVLVGAFAIVLWGAMAMAGSPMLQAAAMRAAPADPDGASSLYVTAFQIGIMAGSLLGGLLYEKADVSMMLSTSTVLVTGALVAIVASRRLFVIPATTRGVISPE